MIGNWNDSDTQKIADGFDYMPTMREVAERIEEEPFCVQWRDDIRQKQGLHRAQRGRIEGWKHGNSL